MYQNEINSAKEKFGRLLEKQLVRVQGMKQQLEFTDYTKLDKIMIGICGGDGIGPVITDQATRVINEVLKNKILTGRVEIRKICGLTIENRSKEMKAIPDQVLTELRQCHVILKGPTTTPRKDDKWPNIESANVAMRKARRSRNSRQCQYRKKLCDVRSDTWFCTKNG